MLQNSTKSPRPQVKYFVLIFWEAMEIQVLTKPGGIFWSFQVLVTVDTCGLSDGYKK